MKQNYLFHLWHSALLPLLSSRAFALKRCFPLLLLGLLLVACQNEATSAYEVISEGQIRAGDTVPTPTDEVILTVSGDIATHNVAETLQFDMATLESLPLAQYTVHDPWLNEDITYKGILLSDFVTVLAVGDGATALHITALDNYEVDISLADIETWPILLATQSNGDYMTVENGGPVRVAFPYHAYEEIDPVTHDDLWIWNIVTIEVQ